MRRLLHLNLGQRIVLVVALAAVFHTMWIYTITPSGWFGYAGSGGYFFGGAGPAGWFAGLVSVALTVLWAAVSVWLLGGPPRPSE